MELYFQTFRIHKRFALTISRGTTAKSNNIWIRVKQEEIEGWGEVSAFSLDNQHRYQTKSQLEELREITPILDKYHPWEIQKLEATLRELGVSPPVKAGIDTACWDWLGKKAKLPLWKLWGLDLKQIPPTSLTIGITSPELAQARAKKWEEIIPNPIFKLKLGSKEGIEADQALVLAIRELYPQTELTVDANGGWNEQQAIIMAEWLANQGVKYIEQPTARGEEAKLTELYLRSPLPIFVDESCLNSDDLPLLTNCVHGINIKLMKAGGLTEVIKMIHIAKAMGFKIMYGCYSDSSLANTAMSHLAPLADYLDLDSHLNLLDDPFYGATIHHGKLIPPNLPGLGVIKNAENHP